MEVFVSRKERFRKKLFFRLKIYLLIVFVIGGLGGIFFLLIDTPFFKINTLEITGNQQLTKSDILNGLGQKVFDNYTAQLLGFDNFFSWPSGNLNLDQPVIQKANFTKDFWHHKVEINITERKKYGAWCGNNESPSCFWFDENGIAFATAPTLEGGLFLKVMSPTRQKISLGGPVLESNLFNNFKKIAETVKNYLTFQKFIWEENNFDLSIKTDDGPLVMFNLRFDPSVNLAALNQMQKKLPWKNFSVIDLRVENRVYYK